MTTKRVRTGLRITEEQNLKLAMCAENIGISKNALIIQAIQEYMWRHEPDMDDYIVDNK